MKERAVGTVVGALDIGEGGEYQLVEFHTRAGKKVRFTGHVTLIAGSSTIGAEIPVRYRSKRPEGAHIDTFRGTWLRSVVWLLGGAGGWVLLLWTAARHTAG